MLETQQINRAMAEALTEQGIYKGLAWDTRWFKCTHCEAVRHTDNFYGPKNGDTCPECMVGALHFYLPLDFTDPSYLLPALEAWTDKNHAGWTLWKWQVNNDSPSTTHAASVFIVYGDRWEGASNEPFEALRNAFAAALTGGAQ